MRVRFETVCDWKTVIARWHAGPAKFHPIHSFKTFNNEMGEEKKKHIGSIENAALISVRYISVGISSLTLF